MNERAIRSVVVLGGGITGLSAAAAFARTLPQVAVTLVETPVEPGALTDRLPGSQPAIQRFHQLIGLEEAELIASGAATWRIGMRFRNWSASGADWIHFTGECGPQIGTIGFHHLWARAARSGDALPWHRYAAAGVMAEAGRFVLPVDDSASPLASYDYALRIIPERYRQLLARHCGRLGVVTVPGALAGAELDATGAVAAILLADGRRLSGDLYLDCAGPAAPLLSRLASDVESMSGWLPACRVAIMPGIGEPGAVDEIERVASGWRWNAPGAGSGEVAGPDDDLPGSVSVTPSRQRTPWRRNVVAIGDAAATLDPLGWAGLTLAHRSIELALELLPDRDFHAVELAGYNRRATAIALAQRDFAALFYHCSNVPDGPFWRGAASLELPPTLSATLEQFHRRGYLVPADEDCIGESSWIAALAGLGDLPEHTDPLAAAIPVEPAGAAMARWAQGLATIPPRLPSYRDYLAETLRRL